MKIEKTGRDIIIKEAGNFTGIDNDKKIYTNKDRTYTDLSIHRIDIESITKTTKHFKTDTTGEFTTVTIEYKDIDGNKHKVTFFD